MARWFQVLVKYRARLSYQVFGQNQQTGKCRDTAKTPENDVIRNRHAKTAFVETTKFRLFYPRQSSDPTQDSS